MFTTCLKRLIHPARKHEVSKAEEERAVFIMSSLFPPLLQSCRSTRPKNPEATNREVNFSRWDCPSREIS